MIKASIKRLSEFLSAGEDASRMQRENTGSLWVAAPKGTSRVHSLHVTRNGVSIRWHWDRTVTVLPPLKGHKTSYDTDTNSPPLVITAERETQRDSRGAPKGLRGNDREPHDGLCH